MSDESAEQGPTAIASRKGAISRDDLYEIVWSEPMLSACRKFGISDVALAKACRRHRIPVPGRGYWAQKAAGQKLRRARLPVLAEADARMLGEVRFVGRRGSDLARSAEGSIPRHPPIEVPDELLSPLPLVRRSRAALRRGVIRDGVLQISEQPCLDIHVAKSSVDRALRISNALLGASADLGYSVAIDEKAPYLTFVHVREERIGIRIEERIERTIKAPSISPRRVAQTVPYYSYPTYECKGTGVLTVRLLGVEYSGLRQSWRDGKRQRVEQCLAGVLDTLDLAAEHLKQRRLEHEQRQREWDEAERQRIEKRRDQEEKRRREELTQLAAAWDEAARLRRFLQAIMLEAGQGGGTLEPDSGLANWLRWAERYVEHLDPMKRLVSEFREDSEEGDAATDDEI
jgi:hypothetical protein